MGISLIFLKINVGILKIQMSSMVKVLQKLVEMRTSGALARGSDLNHVVSMVTALVLTSKGLFLPAPYAMIFLTRAWATKPLFS